MYRKFNYFINENVNKSTYVDLVLRKIRYVVCTTFIYNKL